MFIQVIKAKVADADGLQRQLDRWEREIRPGAEGFLGSTGGLTDDGRVIAFVRFESEEAAQRNSERPEQGAWWAETEKTLSDVHFKNSSEVLNMGPGGSDDAGFVQVMAGRIVDPAKAEALRARMDEFTEGMTAHRPDVLGGISVFHDDGTYEDVIYFKSEAEARDAEGKEMPAELQAQFEDFMSAFEIDEYLDLKAPRMT